ncbi:MAG: GGDEF domain-containing protein [Methylocystaceae bacterium]|nr:GGDEF domain-containing protein [Methylocystaceae bacterium]
MFDFDDIAPLGHENPSDEAKAFLENAKRVLDFAFQPIVDIHNGTVFGYEALLRHHAKMDVATIFALFDRADELKILHRFDMMIRARVIAKFSKLPRNHRTRLFYNLDNRIITSPDYFRGGTKALLKQYDLPAAILCLEISERHEVSMKMAEQNLARYRGEDYSTAIDDFGSGYSGLKLLHEHQPDYIKIDGALIRGIDKDKKLKLMVSTITDLAHVLGIFVIAEGVETEDQLRVCKEIGCDLVQGFFICYPQLDPQALQTQYQEVLTLGRRQKTGESEETNIIYEQIEYRPPLRIDDDMQMVFEAFRSNKDLTFFPIVDESGSPLGIVHEHALKEYTYSPFGKDLIANRGAGLTLRKFLSPCPVADIQAGTDAILKNYSLSENPEGVILVKDFSYLGFLSASSLLRVINENNLAQARDCSPLTKLPGNSSISDFVSDAVSQCMEPSVLVYMDLDNFKAFNDAYGFRQGDRAILLFAELMRKTFVGETAFLGHVGGDDFFIGIHSEDFEAVKRQVTSLLAKFADDVVSFYDAVAREQGFLEGKDRDGNPRRFPLMSCSAALIELKVDRAENTPSFEELDNAIAQLKKQAKSDPSHLAVCCF